MPFVRHRSLTTSSNITQMLLFILTICEVMCMNTVLSNSVYVSSISGDVSASCGSISSPCGTIQSAVENSKNGDFVVLLKDGIYNETNVIVSSQTPCISFVGNATDTIWNCYYPDPSTNNSYGALQYKYNSNDTSCSQVSIANISFQNCMVKNVPDDNNNSIAGGAINMQNHHIHHVLIENCEFILCSAVSTNKKAHVMGGAVFSYSSDLTVINCVFRACSILGTIAEDVNVAFSYSGAAIYAEGYGTINISMTTFTECYISSNGGFGNGGAINVLYRKVSIENSSFVGNYITSIGEFSTVRGGAVYINGSSLSNIQRCQYANNSVKACGNATGGAIYMMSMPRGNSIVIDSSFVNNSAVTCNITTKLKKTIGIAVSGALYHVFGNEAQYENLVFMDNSAIGAFGALSFAEAGGAEIENVDKINLSNIIATGNRARSGISDSISGDASAASLFLNGVVNAQINGMQLYNNSAIGEDGTYKAGNAMGIVMIKVKLMRGWNLNISGLLAEKNIVQGGNSRQGIGGSASSIVYICTFPYPSNTLRKNVDGGEFVTLSSCSFQYNAIQPGYSSNKTHFFIPKQTWSGRGGVLEIINVDADYNHNLYIYDCSVHNNKLGHQMDMLEGTEVMGSSVYLTHINAIFHQFNISGGVSEFSRGTVSGGGIAAFESEISWADSVINDCGAIVNSFGHSAGGGAIFLNASILIVARMSIHNNIVYNERGHKSSSIHSSPETVDSVQNAKGGAIYAVCKSSVMIMHSVVFNNSATFGGFAFVDESSLLNISYSDIISNQAMFGGAIYIDPSPNIANQLVLEHSNFTLNTASYGAVVFFGGNPFTNQHLVRNLFANNTAQIGGGVFFVSSRQTENEWSLIKATNHFCSNSAAYGSIVATLLQSIQLITNATSVSAFPGGMFLLISSLYDSYSQPAVRPEIGVLVNFDHTLYHIARADNLIYPAQDGSYVLPGFLTLKPGDSTNITFKADIKYTSIENTFFINSKPCPPGFWYDEKQSVCVQCAVGTYSLQTCDDSSCCQNCQINSFQDTIAEPMSLNCMAYVSGLYPKIHLILDASNDTLKFQITEGYWPESTTTPLLQPDKLLSCPAGNMSCLPFNCTAFYSIDSSWQVSCSYGNCTSTTHDPYVGCCHSENGFYDRLCSRCLCSEDACWYQSNEASCTACHSYDAYIIVIWGVVLVISLAFYAMAPQSSLILFVIEVVATGFLLLLGVVNASEMSVTIVLLLLALVSGKHLAHGVVSTFVFFTQSLAVFPAQAWPHSISLEFFTVWDFRFLPVSCIFPSLAIPFYQLLLELILPWCFIIFVVAIMSITFLLSKFNCVFRCRMYVGEQVQYYWGSNTHTNSMLDAMDDGDANRDRLSNSDMTYGSFQMISLNNILDNETPSVQKRMKQYLQLTIPPKEMFLYEVVKAVLFLSEYFYFKIASAVFGILSCEDGYVSNYLWIPCSFSDSQFLAMFVISVVIIVVYVGGFYILVAGLLFANRTAIKSNDHKLVLWLGVYYDHFKKNVFWFELVLLSRRLLLSAVTSIIPNGNAIQVSLALSVFLLAAVAVGSLTPYKEPFENYIDILGCCLLAWSFGMGWIGNLGLSYNTAAQYVTLAANLCFILILLFLMIAPPLKHLILFIWSKVTRKYLHDQTHKDEEQSDELSKDSDQEDDALLAMNIDINSGKNCQNIEDLAKEIVRLKAELKKLEQFVEESKIDDLKAEITIINQCKQHVEDQLIQEKHNFALLETNHKQLNCTKIELEQRLTQMTKEHDLLQKQYHDAKDKLLKAKQQRKEWNHKFKRLEEKERMLQNELMKSREEITLCQIKLGSQERTTQRKKHARRSSF